MVVGVSALLLWGRRVIALALCVGLLGCGLSRCECAVPFHVRDEEAIAAPRRAPSSGVPAGGNAAPDGARPRRWLGLTIKGFFPQPDDGNAVACAVRHVQCLAIHAPCERI